MAVDLFLIDSVDAESIVRANENKKVQSDVGFSAT